MSSSVEAHDVIAKVVREGREGAYYDETIAADVVAALSEAGFTVIRTDPETMDRAAAAMFNSLAGFVAALVNPALPAVQTDAFSRQALACALVVLRGDPQ